MTEQRNPPAADRLAQTVTDAIEQAYARIVRIDEWHEFVNWIADDILKDMLRIAIEEYRARESAPAQEGWVLVPKEPTAEMIAGAAIAIWPPASDSYFQMARDAALIVLREGTYQLAPGTSLDTIAAGIATMAAAYRAMIAAAPRAGE